MPLRSKTFILYQKQDIYFSTSYILISSKPSKTETFEDLVFKGSEETET